MSVYRRKTDGKDAKVYAYDFEYKGTRYRGSTGQTQERLAREWEQNYRVTLRKTSGGLELKASETPTFTEWAEVYIKHLQTKERRKRKSMETIIQELRIALAFWGATPTKQTPVAGGVYHNLRLGDPLADLTWFDKFDDWLASRKCAPSYRGNLLSHLSGLYRVAKLPAYQKTTGVRQNPFREIPREKSRGRDLTLTPEQLRAWIDHAAPHIQLALAIGSLGPKLRLGNVLSLTWDKHLDPALTWITVWDHKTDQTGKPMVVPITDELRPWLLAARGERKAGHVITWRGKPVTAIKKALRRAAERAGIPYGRLDGATYHSLRHLAATILAEQDVTDAKCQATMGWTEARTMARYRHLRPVAERPPLTMLATVLQLPAGVVTPTRIGRQGMGAKPRTRSAS